MVYEYRLSELLEGVDPKDLPTLKGAEISKFGPQDRQTVGDYDIQIMSMSPIEKGVAVLARAWEADGRQIGFGVDGSVDIERFCIFNPPIMAEVGGSLVEDPILAVLQTVAHAVVAKSHKHGPEMIIEGRVGNTTSTFYPDATHVDGYVWKNGGSWVTVRGAATGLLAYYDQGTIHTLIEASASTNQWAALYRSIVNFDTSPLGDGDTINSATLSVYVTSTEEGISGLSIGLTACTTSIFGTISTSHYPEFGSTQLATAKLISSISTGAFSDYSLNASGLGHVNRAGTTSFMVRILSDIVNSEPTWVDSARSKITWVGYSAGGTSQDPVLVVDHTFVATSTSTTTTTSTSTSTSSTSSTTTTTSTTTTSSSTTTTTTDIFTTSTTTTTSSSTSTTTTTTSSSTTTTTTSSSTTSTTSTSISTTTTVTELATRAQFMAHAGSFAE